MRKSTFYCDRCGTEVNPNLKLNSGLKNDLCSRCLLAIVVHYFDNVWEKCGRCGGKGTTREYVGYHNDFNNETCPTCDGKKFIDRKVF